jgi:hypothetical protein
MSEPTSTQVRLGLLPANQAFHAAFSGPSWSGAASFASLDPKPPVGTRVLSVTGSLLASSPPAVFLSGERVMVVHASPRGVEVTPLDPRRTSELAFPDATTFAIAMGRRTSRLFSVDMHGLNTARFDPKEGCGPTDRWLTHAGKNPRISAARAGEGELAFVAWEGERALYVAVELDGKPRVVRHELEAECVGIAAFGAGNRAGIAVAMAESERIDVAIVDARGMIVERLHTCLEGRGAVWRDPAVLFIEDTFHVLAVDEKSERTVVARFDDGEIVLDITGQSGPFSAAYYEKQLYVARATVDDVTDVVTVAGHRLSPGGRAASRPFELTLAPPLDLWRARASMHAERVIRATHAELDTARQGYRGEGAREGASVHLEEDPHALRFDPQHASFGSTLLGVRPCETRHAPTDTVAVGYDVTLLALAKGTTTEPMPEGSLEKLARWVRERLSRRAFELAVKERAWIDRVAGALGGHGFWDLDENGLRLIVHVTRPPDPVVLAAWCKRVLSDLASRVWERASAPPP